MSALISPGMTENLVAEFLGLFFGAILFTWIGGSIARRSASRMFDKRWAEYRRNLAIQLDHYDGDLQRLLWVAGVIDKIREKDLDILARSDLEEYRFEISALERTFSWLENLIANHHFCLREHDIRIAQEYISAITDLRRKAITEQQSTLGNFESQLAYILEDKSRAAERFPAKFFDGTRHELMQACGKVASENLRACYKGKTSMGVTPIRLGQALNK